MFAEPKLSFQEVPEPAMKAFEGESLTITCQAKGVPPPTIHWLKNGKRINQVSLLAFVNCTVCKNTQCYTNISPFCCQMVIIDHESMYGVGFFI